MSRLDRTAVALMLNEIRAGMWLTLRYLSL
jgi:hypothetical protein